MALQTGLYPVEGRLILDPTTYTGNDGTDLGKLAASSLAGIDFDGHFLTKHATGYTPTDIRYTGMNCSFIFSLLHASSEVIDLMFRKTNTNDSFVGFNGYKMGAIASSSQLFSFLVRPIDDDGTVDTDKPFLYIPRGAVIKVEGLAFDKQIGHYASTAITVAALYDSTISSSFEYGDQTEFGAL